MRIHTVDCWHTRFAVLLSAPNHTLELLGGDEWVQGDIVMFLETRGREQEHTGNILMRKIVSITKEELAGLNAFSVELTDADHIKIWEPSNAAKGLAR